MNVRKDARRLLSPSQFERAVPRSTMASLPHRAKIQIRLFQIRCLLPLLGRTRYGRVVTPGGCRVYVHAETLAIDVITLDYVWRKELFPVDLRDRVVLDIGSHKGYFGALALAAGARAVYSYEPESVNHGALMKATVPGRDAADWHRERTAVGAESGSIVLSISSESWSHSIHTPASGTVLRTETVPLVAFGKVLAEVAARHPDQPTVLKLNVEGAAGDCLLSVPPQALRELEVLLVDLEANTPQPLSDILGHLSVAGFDLVQERELIYHFVKRSTREDPFDRSRS